MTAPLYRGAWEAAAAAFQPRAGAAGPFWGGNAGLWYDKFCDRWKPDFSGLVEPKGAKDEVTPGGKQEWIDSVIHPNDREGRPGTGKPPVKTGDPTMLAEHARRRRAMVEAQGGRVLDCTLTARFATGLGRSHPVENGFAWHHSLGVPFLAGAGVKGLMRAWAGLDASKAVIDRVFGPPAASGALEVGSLIVLDAVPVAPVTLVAEVMTPHTGPWNLADPASPASLEPPADWHSPNPIPFLAVEAGTTFQFALLARTADTPLDDAARWLGESLSWLGAGAKTATGFGRFAPSGTRPTDPILPDAFTTASTAPTGRSGARPAIPSAPPRRGTVDGEPVEILRREGGKVVVQFVERGDIETVDESEISQ